MDFPIFHRKLRLLQIYQMIFILNLTTDLLGSINLQEILVLLVPRYHSSHHNSCNSGVFTPCPYLAKGYCHYNLIHLSVCPLIDVTSLTNEGSQLGSSNWCQQCILGYTGLIFKIKVISVKMTYSLDITALMHDPSLVSSSWWDISGCYLKSR